MNDKNVHLPDSNPRRGKIQQQFIHADFVSVVHARLVIEQAVALEEFFDFLILSHYKRISEGL